MPRNGTRGRGLLADPAYEKGFNFLSDGRGLKNAPTTASIREATAFLARHARDLGPCRFAFVVSGTAAFGMYHMSWMLTQGTGVDVDVFTDLDEALAWLRAGPPARPARPGVP